MLLRQHYFYFFFFHLLSVAVCVGARTTNEKENMIYSLITYGMVNLPGDNSLSSRPFLLTDTRFDVTDADKSYPVEEKGSVQWTNRKAAS